MENGREVPEGRETKETQLEKNAPFRDLNGKKKTTSDDHPKFLLWGKGGLMSPWEAAKRAELISGGKEKRSKSQKNRMPRSGL